MKYLLILAVLSFIACEDADEPFDCSECPAGITGYEIVAGETALDASVTKQLRVDCPEGKRMLGAGWSVLDSTSAILDGISTYSEPSYDGTHWLVNARKNSTFATDWKLRMRCVCADVISE